MYPVRPIQRDMGRVSRFTHVYLAVVVASGAPHIQGSRSNQETEAQTTP